MKSSIEAPLWNKGPEQTIVSLVLRTLPGGVRVGKEDLGTPLLYLGEDSKLVAIVHSEGFKDLRAVLSVLIMEGVHELHHRLAGLAVNTEDKVGLRFSSSAHYTAPGVGCVGHIIS